MEDRENLKARCFIYLSGPDEAALTAQELLCRKMVREILGVTDDPVPVCRDIVGKGNALRPGRDAMLQAAEDGKISDLVVVARNCLSMSLPDYILIEFRLHQANVHIHFAEGCPDGSTEGNTTMHTVYYTECREFQETGKRPYGGPENETSRANGNEALVQKIFRMAGRQMSPGDIAAVLNQERITTQRGGPWAPREVRRILTGILHCGECGRPMMTITKRKGIRFYHCPNSSPDPDGDWTCNAPTVAARATDQRAWALAEDLVREPDNLARLLREANPRLTPEEEQDITEYCLQQAPILETLDRQGKRNVLLTLGLHCTMQDGIDIRIEFRKNLTDSEEAGE